MNHHQINLFKSQEEDEELVQIIVSLDLLCVILICFVMIYSQK